MWDVQGVTEALDMGPEDKVIWPKQCLDAVAHLVTNLKKDFLWVDCHVDCIPCLWF